MYGFIFIACFRRVLECSAVLGLFLLGEYEKQRNFGVFHILLAQIEKASFVAFSIT